MIKRLFLLGILSGILFTACSQEQQPTQEEAVKTVNVEVREIQKQPFERYLKLVGTVEAPNDVRISAEVSGQIEKYFVEPGDDVKQGDPILKIDDLQLIRERERLEAVTAQAKDNYERLKQLYEQDSVGSEIEYLNAKYNFEQNKASLEAVKVNIAKTTVKAPFDATVENILLEQGEMATPGAVLIRLIGTKNLKISTGVPSTYSDVVNKGDMAQVWFDFQQADTLQLPITFVGKSISPQARTFEVEVKLPPKVTDYKVDMLANLKIRTLGIKDAIVIGEEFVYESEGKNVVYLVGEDKSGEKVARSRRVQLGASYKNEVVIAEGLTVGEQLITVGSAFLQDSMRINVVESRQSRIAQQNL
jgi:RND family efflux transporter MFP subunit